MAVAKTNKPVPKTVKSNPMTAFSLLNEISFTIPNTVEKEETVNGNKYVTWGDYYPSIHTLNPEFYSEIASRCPTLSAIISKRQDYLMGKGIEWNTEWYNKNWDNIVFKCFKDIQTYGGFALQIGWNGLGYEIEYIKIKNLRSNKDFTKFFYYEDWLDRKPNTYQEFEAFDGSKSRKVQIFYYKEACDSHYPTPMYVPALTACDTQIRIQDFNNNSVANNFNVSGYLTVPVSNPTDDEINQIEYALASKFSGNKNAAKFFALTYDPSHINGAKPELNRLGADSGFTDQYTTIDQNTKDKIYQTMKAIPALFGDVTATTGFNTQEFQEAFKQELCYINRVQSIITRLFNELFGEGSMIINQYIDAEEKIIDSEQILKIITSGIPVSQQKALLRLSMKLTDEEINLLFNIESNELL